MIPPLENLKFWAGAGLVALVLSISHLLDGPSEIEASQATEASPPSKVSADPAGTALTQK